MPLLLRRLTQPHRAVGIHGKPALGEAEHRSEMLLQQNQQPVTVASSPNLILRMVPQICSSKLACQHQDPQLKGIENFHPNIYLEAPTVGFHWWVFMANDISAKWNIHQKLQNSKFLFWLTNIGTWRHKDGQWLKYSKNRIHMTMAATYRTSPASSRYSCLSCPYAAPVHLK